MSSTWIPFTSTFSAKSGITGKENAALTSDTLPTTVPFVMTIGEADGLYTTISINFFPLFMMSTDSK